MKKVLFLTLFCFLTFLPNNVMAMVEYDENGKIIERGANEGEVFIMADPDMSISSYDQAETNEDGDFKITEVNEDAVYKTTAQEKDDVFTTTSTSKSNDSLPFILIGGSVLAIAGGIVFIKKKQNSLVKAN